MRVLFAVPLALLVACAGPAQSLPSASASRSLSGSPTPQPVASVISGPAPSTAFASLDCDAAEAKQFDFWVGTWDVAWEGPSGPLKGTNTITKQGCIVIEHFDGPLGAPGYIGNSASAWVPSLKKWVQHYRDTSGFVASYVGGVEGSAFILYRATPSLAIANNGRLVWRDITPDRMVWTNDRSLDNGATWTAQLTITYTRRR